MSALQPFDESGNPDRRHADYVRSIARALLSDEHLAEDVAQEAWLACLKRRRSRPLRSPRAFLRTVAYYVAINLRRASDRRDARERASALPESQPSVEEKLAQRSIKREVIRAVESLREPYRTAIRLRFFEERPPRVIAAELGVSVETVHTRLRRGLEHLRERLDREFGGNRESWTTSLIPLLELGTKPERPLLGAGTAIVVATFLVGGLFLFIAFSAASSDERLEPVARGAGVATRAVPGLETGERNPAPNRSQVLRERLVRVVVNEDGRALRGIDVTAAWGGQSRFARTGADGRTDLEVPVGQPFTVRAQATEGTGLVEIESFLDVSDLEADVLTLRVPSLRTLTGRALDEEGQPVVGARVSFWLGSRPTSIYRLAPFATTETDASGTFLVAGLPARFLAGASAPGTLSERLILGVDVPQGRFELDLRMSPEREVAGRLWDEDGRPLSARVELSLFGDGAGLAPTLHAGLTYEPRWPVVRWTPSGRFVLKAVPGVWTLRVAKPRFVPHWQILDLESKIADLEVRLRRGATLEVQVLDSQGVPTPGVAVLVKQGVEPGAPPRSEGDRPLLSENTDAAGVCSFEGLAPGTIALVSVRRPPAAAILVDVESGHQRVEVRTATRRVDGVTVDSGNRPVPGVRVIAHLALDYDRIREAGLLPVRALVFMGRATSGPDGRFVLEGLSGTEVVLRCVWPREICGVRSMSRQVLAAGKRSVRLVAPTEEQVFAVSGTVSDERGKPLPQAAVVFVSTKSPWKAELPVEPDGTFSARLPTGERWTVLVRAEAYGGIRRALTASEGTESSEFVLHSSRSLSVRILDRRGRVVPLASAQVRAQSGDEVLLRVRPGQAQTLVMADARAALLLSGLPKTTLEVVVRTPWTLEPTVFELDLSQPVPDALDLVLENIDVSDSTRPVDLRVVGIENLAAAQSYRGAPRAGTSPYPGWVDIRVLDGADRVRLGFRVDPSQPGALDPVGTYALVKRTYMYELGPGNMVFFRDILPNWAGYGGELVFDREAPLTRLPFPASACRLEVRSDEGVRFEIDLPEGELGEILTVELPAPTR